MLDKLKDTAKHTIIYSIGNLSSKIIGLILLPLYTAKLTLLNYGQFTILEVTSVFMVMVFGLRIVTAMLRWCSEETDKEKRKTIVFTTFVTLLVVVGILNAVLMPFRRSFSFLFFNSAEYINFFTVIIISVSFEILNGIPFNLLRYKQKSVIYIILFSLKLFIVLAMNFYFLLVLETGVIGIFLSQLIGNVIIFIVTLPYILKNIKPKFEYRLLKEMVNYSFPLVFSAISVQLLTIGDRFIIKYFLDYSQVGIYSLAYKIAGVLNVFIIQSFMLGYLPIAYKMINLPDAGKFYSNIFKYLSFILIFAALGLSLYSKEILEIFAKNPEFWIACKIIPILTLTFVFKGIQYFFSLGFHYVKKTRFNALIVMVGVIVNFSLNFLLIPIWGIWGAALTTIVSAVFIMILMYILSQKYYPVKYEIHKFIIVLVVGIGLFSVSFAINELSFIIRIFLKLLLIGIYPLVLYLFSFYETTELDKMKKFLIKWQNKLIP